MGAAAAPGQAANWLAQVLADETLPPPERGDALDRLQGATAVQLGDSDFGFDAKYGLTQNLAADFTFHTDFAQVEADEQQVNLTRFSLSYPEKRDFFLEGRGIFDFARGSGFGGGGGAATVPTMFYSRRIGLNGSHVIPIDIGERVTGKVGPIGIGLMNIQTGDEAISHTPSTNFTVVRLKRDILRRSEIGMIFANRSKSVVADPCDVRADTRAFNCDGA